jgi:hypothetical protein
MRFSVRGKDAAMTRFDLAEVRDFTAGIGTRIDRCLAGAGTECAPMDAALRHFADLCREFCDQVRRWGDAVFSGRVEFDPEVERILKEEGWRLHSRVTEARDRAETNGMRHDSLSGQNALQAAFSELDRLLNRWVTPKLAVGPSATRWKYPHQAATEEEIRQVAALPPLPADWEPIDPDQRERFRGQRKGGYH